MLTAADICQWFKLKPEAQSLLQPDQTPREFFEILVERELYADARRVLAHTLPSRRAIWWGCLCAWEAYRAKPPEPILQATLDMVVRWVLSPTEENLWAAERGGWKAGVANLASSLAMAVYVSGPSLSRPGLPPVPPKPFLTGRLVGVAVYLASVHRDPAHYRERLLQYLTMGREIAQGKNLWPEATPREQVPARLILPEAISTVPFTMAEPMLR